MVAGGERSPCDHRRHVNRQASRNKGIDINAPLAEQMGYVQNKKQAEATGKQVFPTGKNIEWEEDSVGGGGE
jgi:hypothetical protein